MSTVPSDRPWSGCRVPRPVGRPGTPGCRTCCLCAPRSRRRPIPTTCGRAPRFRRRAPISSSGLGAGWGGNAQHGAGGQQGGDQFHRGSLLRSMGGARCWAPGRRSRWYRGRSARQHELHLHAAILVARRSGYRLRRLVSAVAPPESTGRMLAHVAGDRGHRLLLSTSPKSGMDPRRTRARGPTTSWLAIRRRLFGWQRADLDDHATPAHGLDEGERGGRARHLEGDVGFADQPKRAPCRRGSWSLRTTVLGHPPCAPPTTDGIDDVGDRDASGAGRAGPPAPSCSPSCRCR